jgi:hypothetical protein
MRDAWTLPSVEFYRKGNGIFDLRRPLGTAAADFRLNQDDAAARRGLQIVG